MIIAGAAVLGYIIGIVAAISWCVCSGILAALFVYDAKKRYEDIEKLNDYLSMVLSGNYDLAIASNEEGELSVLKNNIYKTTVLLKEQNEQLRADKMYLADALADISHQLKTPLTSMMVMNDLLETQVTDERPKQFGLSSVICVSNKSFITIIEVKGVFNWCEISASASARYILSARSCSFCSLSSTVVL